MSKEQYPSIYDERIIEIFFSFALSKAQNVLHQKNISGHKYYELLFLEFKTLLLSKQIGSIIVERAVNHVKDFIWEYYSNTDQTDYLFNYYTHTISSRIQEPEDLVSMICESGNDNFFEK